MTGRDCFEAGTRRDTPETAETRRRRGDLPADVWSASTYARLLAQYKLEPVLPSLRTLVLSDLYVIPDPFGVPRDPEIERQRTKEWWDAMGQALSKRRYTCGVGGVRVLRLEGSWWGMNVWSKGEDWWDVEEVRGKGVVGRVVDDRVWVKCAIRTS